MFIYETCVLLDPSVTEESCKQVISQTQEAIEKGGGETLLTDEWGFKTLAQPTSRGRGKGYYIYLLYLADGQVNIEIERRYRINELILKHIILKKGPAPAREAILKAYVTPYASSSAHHPSEEEVNINDKEKRLFARRRSCYFKANKVEPDWKNPYTYKWLVNDFGKISPARVTGLSSRYQRAATTAIKQARCIGLISHVSKNFAL